MKFRLAVLLSDKYAHHVGLSDISFRNYNGHSWQLLFVFQNENMNNYHVQVGANDDLKRQTNDRSINLTFNKLVRFILLQCIK